MIRTTLPANWVLHPLGEASSHLPESVPATVPGCFHTDLLAAALIPDPYLDRSEDALRWLFDLDWEYRTTLTPEAFDLSRPDDDERVELVFDGLDTVATVTLGRAALGTSYNMHRSYRYDVTPLLDGSAKELSVRFESATRYANEQADLQGHLPSTYPTPFNAIRKMACSFGWDWGPDLRTAGIWRPARLERWRLARLASVRPNVSVMDGVGLVEVVVELDWAGRQDVELTAELRQRADGGNPAEAVEPPNRTTVLVPAGQRRATLTLQIDDPPLWWPVGHGDQPLHDLTVTLQPARTHNSPTPSDPGEADQGEVLDSWERRVGFRTVSVDTSPDEFGTRFTIQVNGRPIFAKGVNWIPDDHFVTRITPERLARRLDQAVDANINLIRVWGGGMYESDDFYDACDERGLLVWQDFPLACATYSESEPLRSEFEAEARENVTRLVSHPSLTILNGGNENFWGHEDWGWIDELQGRSWGGWYAAELFPRVVAELASGVAYSVNSPYSPGALTTARHPNDPDHGTHHEWEVWNRRDYVHYADDIPRFCSEFGFQGPPTWRTLTDWLHTDDGASISQASDPKNHPTFLAHQKAADGNAKLDAGLAPHLGIPDDFADWHWATQLNQAHAVEFAIDHYRRHWPRTAGAIVWQLNDCWPVTSWAAIDSEERPKPLYYALRQSFAPRRIVFGAGEAGLEVSVLNDTDDAWQGDLTLRREIFDGTRLAETALTIAVPPRSVTTLPIPADLATPDDAPEEALVAELDDVTRVHLFAEIKDAALEPDPLDVKVEETENGYAIHVTARSLVKDLMFHVDHLAPDAVADAALIDLPAGSSTTIHVKTQGAGLAERLVSPHIDRTANQLVSFAD